MDYKTNLVLHISFSFFFLFLVHCLYSIVFLISFMDFLINKLYLACFMYVILSCLLIAALWSPAGKGLTSWLSFMWCFIVLLSLSSVVSYVRCGTWFYYIPINDTTLELSVFWPSDTESWINELRFSESKSLSFKTRLSSVTCFCGDVT